MRAEDVIEEARTWIGTPFHHQARKKGQGADCIGFLSGVCEALGVDTQSVPSQYAAMPDGQSIEAYLAGSPLVKKCDAETLPEPGLIVLFKIYKDPQHFGILTPGTARLNILHAYRNYGVVEVPFDERWQGRMLSLWQLTFVD